MTYTQEADYFCVMAKTVRALELSQTPENQPWTDLIGEMSMRLIYMIQTHGYADGLDHDNLLWNRGITTNGEYFIAIAEKMEEARDKADRR